MDHVSAMFLVALLTLSVWSVVFMAHVCRD